MHSYVIHRYVIHSYVFNRYGLLARSLGSGRASEQPTEGRGGGFHGYPRIFLMPGSGRAGELPWVGVRRRGGFYMPPRSFLEEYGLLVLSLCLARHPPHSVNTAGGSRGTHTPIAIGHHLRRRPAGRFLKNCPGSYF